LFGSTGYRTGALERKGSLEFGPRRHTDASPSRPNIGSAPVTIIRERAGSIGTEQQREAEALLEWQHREDTREVFENRTPQQWKEEKEALEKRVWSPRRDLPKKETEALHQQGRYIRQGGATSGEEEKKQATKQRLEEAKKEIERERKALAEAQRQMADERRRTEDEWRVLNEEKQRMYQDKRDAKRQLESEWSLVNEEKKKLWEQYKELEEILSRLYNKFGDGTAM
jgi:hypothetical protein